MKFCIIYTAAGTTQVHDIWRMGYEEEFLTCLQSLIGEVEKKIRRGHARLALNQAHSNVGFLHSDQVFAPVC